MRPRTQRQLLNLYVNVAVFSTVGIPLLCVAYLVLTGQGR